MYRWGFAFIVILAITFLPLPIGASAPSARSIEEPEVVPGVVRVRVRDGLAAASAAITISHPMAGRQPPTILAHEFWVQVPEGQERVEAQHIAQNPLVLWAEPNFIARISLTPADPLYADQWNLDKIQAPLAWDLVLGEGTLVAVIDTGIDLDGAGHPDLVDRLWINPAEIPNNGIDDDSNGLIDDVSGWNFLFSSGYTSQPATGCQQPNPYRSSLPADDHGHGTHVSGIATASLNGTGVVGVAPRASLLPLKAFNYCGSGPNSDIEAAIRYAADNGADVINISAGEPVFSASLQEAVNYAYQRGALIVASSGNAGIQSLNYPGALNNVVAAASTDTNDLRSSFSTYGDFVDIAAPGSSILSTDRRSTTIVGYLRRSGTSMAAPHVSGAAALLKSVQSSLTNVQLETILKANADDVGDALFFGAGRLNVWRAVLAAVSPVVAPVNVLLIVPTGTSPDVQTLRLTNASSIDQAFSLGVQSQADWVSATPLTGTLLAGTTAEIGLTFAPNSAASSGRLTATLTISTTFTTGGPIQVPISVIASDTYSRVILFPVRFQTATTGW